MSKINVKTNDKGGIDFEISGSLNAKETKELTGRFQELSERLEYYKYLIDYDRRNDEDIRMTADDCISDYRAIMDYAGIDDLMNAATGRDESQKSEEKPTSLHGYDEISAWLDNWKNEFKSLNAEEHDLIETGADKETMDAFYEMKNDKALQFMQEMLCLTGCPVSGKCTLETDMDPAQVLKFLQENLQVRYESRSDYTIYYDKITINIGDANEEFLYNPCPENEQFFTILPPVMAENAESRDTMLAFLDSFASEYVDYAEMFSYEDAYEDADIEDFISEGGPDFYAPQYDPEDKEMEESGTKASVYEEADRQLSDPCCVRTPEEEEDLDQIKTAALASILAEEVRAQRISEFHEDDPNHPGPDVVAAISEDLNRKLLIHDELWHVPYSLETMEQALAETGYGTDSLEPDDPARRYIEGIQKDLAYSYEGFDRYQREEIRYGLLEGIDVSVYDDPEISSGEMDDARRLLEFGIPADIVRKAVEQGNMGNTCINFIRSLYEDKPLTQAEINSAEYYIITGMNAEEVVAQLDADRKEEEARYPIHDQSDPVSALIEDASALADAHNAAIKQNPVNRDDVQIGD